MIERTTMQCPECGGEIILTDDGKLGRCSSCENEFRLPSEKGKEKLALINQASFLRRRGDFEGALMLYSDLIKLDPDDPNVYWGKVLAKFGIEYVLDPKTNRSEMTCRRIERISIFEDKSFLSALNLSEEGKRNRYRQEAARIDALQQKIKEKLRDEESYDVFICFKSTDDNEMPTEDRLVARRIFDELQRRGIKTFYSEVTLKDKLGSEYEPIIYKALYSAKVMILVATREEYIDSIWVRNEWTRFRDRIYEENMRDASFAVFKNVERASLPPIFRSQGVDLKKYPFGGYEIEIADTLAKRFDKGRSASPEPKQQPAQQKTVNFTMQNGNSTQNTNQGQHAFTQNTNQGQSTNQGQNTYTQNSFDERVSPKGFNDRAFRSKSAAPEVEPNLSREVVNKELASLVRERQHYVRLKEHAEDAYNVSRGAMKRAADQRKVFAVEKEKLDKILSTPDYFRKSARRRANSILWLRLLLTVLMFVLVFAFVHRPWIIVLILISGVLIIWYRQFVPVSSWKADKKQLICKEREGQLREQIVQCEMQLATLNRKFDKNKQDKLEAENKIRQCDDTLAKYIKLYPYAQTQIEKLNVSVAHKVASVVSDGIINIAGGIDKGITAMKDSLFK